MTAVAVAGDLLGDRAQRDVPLGPYTTYRVGGPSALFVTIESDADLEVVSRAVQASGVDTLVVGRGSNLLVADAGFEGLTIQLGDRYAQVEIDGTTVIAGGAALFPVVARTTAAAGLTGLEWAVGVPGSVGGAVRMNAGGHGSEVAETLQSIRVHDLATGEDGVVASSSLDLGYRHSAVRPTQVVLSAEFCLEHGDVEATKAELRDVVAWRRANQPGGQNAGSVFTNPPGDSAGRLIEAAGLKGHRVGTAEVSPKHANFIQADPGGSADDVYALMTVIRQRVAANDGVELHAETCLVGFGGRDV